MAERILTLRELNRAPLDTMKHLVAMQGQMSNAPYIGLWTRLHTFERASLTHLHGGHDLSDRWLCA